MADLGITFDLELIISLIEEQIDLEVDRYLSTIILERERLQAMNISDDVIKQIFERDAQSMTGVFSGLQNPIGNIAALGTNTINQAVYNDSIATIGGEYYQWVLDDGAQHCSTCPEKENDVHTWDEWVSLGLPGSGVDECKQNCRCSLVPVEVIKKVEKITGTDFNFGANVR